MTRIQKNKFPYSCYANRIISASLLSFIGITSSNYAFADPCVLGGSQTISVSCSGEFIWLGGDLNIGSGVSVNSLDAAVKVNNGVSTDTLTNDGSLFSDNISHGTIYVDGGSIAAIINGSGATILNYKQSAIDNSLGTIKSIVNSGVLSAPKYVILNEQGEIESIVNTETGEIIGTADRAQGITNNGTVGTILNDGLIESTNDTPNTFLGSPEPSPSGIVNNGSVQSITNNGTIKAGGSANGTGIVNSAQSVSATWATIGTLTNTGLISVDSYSPGNTANPPYSVGIENTYGYIATLDNQGSIGAAGYDGAAAYGIENYGTITELRNSGSIVATVADDGVAYGILNRGAGTIRPVATINEIINSGTINSDDYAIYNKGVIEVIDNSGTISGNSYGIYNTELSASIGRITNTGTISGGVTGIDVNSNDGALYISNNGTISGATSLNVGISTVVLAAGEGSTILGDIELNGGSLTISVSDAFVFSDGLTGNGSVTKTGDGILSLTGNSSFTGATDIATGEIEINGSLASSAVTVQTGARLSGSGIVGSLTAQAGSTVAPGNSPGTLTVAENYHQVSGSTYNAEVVADSSTSDHIAVGGTAMIDNGAILNVSKYGSTTQYALDAHYTVLTATDGVTGTYVLAGDTAISAFYSLVANYDANNIYLDAVQTRSFVDAATTPNQIATAGGLQSLAAGNALRSSISYLASDAETQSAFDQLSGEFYSAVKGALVEDSRFVRNAAVDRVRSAFEAVGAQATPSVTYGADGLTLWSDGYGAWSDSNGDGKAAGLSHNIGGFFVGADVPVFETWRFGILGGYSHSTYDEKDRNGSGSSDNYSLGLYGGTQFGNLGLRVGGGYTWSSVDTSRTIAFTDFHDRLTGKYNADTAQIFTDLGYRIDVGQTSLGNLSFEPFTGLAYVNVDTSGFAEQGGMAVLTSNSDDNSFSFSTLGLRGSSDFTVGGFGMTALGTIGWRHAFGDVTPTSTHSFSGSDPFNIASVPIADDAALVEAGLSTRFSTNVDFGVSYTGQFADGIQSQGIRGSLTVKF